MLRSEMFFNDWQSIARTLLVGALAYAVLVLMLRVSGKRTLAKMNSFDLIVTVALGSTLASVLLTKNVALAEGMASFALLITLQFIVTWSSVRAQTVRKLARSEPRLLLHRGKMLHAALHAQRVTESEVLQAIRSAGVLAISDVEGVVLETNGNFSVVKRSEGKGPTTLDGLVARQAARENRRNGG